MIRWRARRRSARRSRLTSDMPRCRRQAAERRTNNKEARTAINSSSSRCREMLLMSVASCWRRSGRWCVVGGCCSEVLRQDVKKNRCCFVVASDDY